MSIFFDPTQPFAPPGQVYIRSLTNPKEFLYIEIQGEINSTLPALQGSDPANSRKQYLWGQPLGQFEEKPDGSCSLIIGNLKLEGTKQILKKPLLIVTKRKAGPDLVKSKPTPIVSTESKAVGDIDTASSLDTVSMGDQDFETQSVQSTFVQSSLSEYTQMVDSFNSVIIAPGERLSSFSPPPTSQPSLEVPIQQSLKMVPTENSPLLSVDGIIRAVVKFSKRPIPLVRPAAASTNQ